jgi:Arabinose-binding domain of AraC transcription regulator, N-term
MTGTLATGRRLLMMYDRVLGAHPTAENTLARLACARATAAGIDAAPLMVKAGLTRQQVEEHDFRLAAQGQIKLLELIAEALRDDLLGFHLGCDLDLRELGGIILRPQFVRRGSGTQQFHIGSGTQQFHIGSGTQQFHIIVIATADLPRLAGHQMGRSLGQQPKSAWNERT